MGDRIDKLMSKRLPDLEKQISAGLGIEPILQKYLPVETLNDARPYRVNSMAWGKEGGSGAWAGLDIANPPLLRRCKPELEGALELAIAYDLDIETLQDNLERVLRNVKSFAEQARLAERRAVLLLLTKKAIEESPFNIEKIKEAITKLSARCRLVAAENNTTAVDARKQGLVEDLVDPKSTLPAGVFAMLLQLGNGPSVRRVVDDLTLTWERKSKTQVELRLSERFFMDNADRAIKFVERGASRDRTT